MLCLSRALIPGLLAHLKDVVGTLTTEVVLAGQDDHWFGEHLQTDGTDKLLLQVIHALWSPQHRLEAHGKVHPRSTDSCPQHALMGWMDDPLSFPYVSMPALPISALSALFCLPAPALLPWQCSLSPSWLLRLFLFYFDLGNFPPSTKLASLFLVCLSRSWLLSDIIPCPEPTRLFLVGHMTPMESQLPFLSQ